MLLCDLLTERTWMQHKTAATCLGESCGFLDPAAKQFCLAAAVWRVCDARKDTSLYWRALKYVQSKMYVNLVDWNDDPVRLWKDVAALMQWLGESR